MTKSPYVSVVVPVKNGGDILPKTLRAICESDLTRDAWELIVVDDGSTDNSSLVAAEYADLVIRIGGRSHGPAYARNRGVERARGEVICFFDADVLVHPDTLGRIVQVFAREPGVSALFGAYDDAPAAPGFVSQYRNLLHHFTHGQNPGDAHTFWGACGAVRRTTFMAAGMFDEWRFSRPQVEDIELGLRIRALGERIVLRPEIEVKHLKAWTLWNTIRTDFKDRGVPWTRLLMEHGDLLSVKEERTRVLNLNVRERINTVLVWLAMGLAGLALLLGKPLLLLAAAVMVAPVLWVNRALYSWFERQRGFAFAFRVLPLHLVYYVINGISVIWGALVNITVGEPRPDPAIEAFSEIGVQTWPPVPLNPKRPAAPVVIPTE